MFQAAAEAGTAIEVDAYPDRQDLDHTLLARAAKAGCMISAGTDSHAVSELRFMDVARAHLVLASVPPDLVLNCMGTPQIMSWLARKSR